MTLLKGMAPVTLFPTTRLHSLMFHHLLIVPQWLHGPLGATHDLNEWVSCFLSSQEEKENIHPPLPALPVAYLRLLIFRCLQFPGNCFLLSHFLCCARGKLRRKSECRGLLYMLSVAMPENV